MTIYKQVANIGENSVDNIGTYSSVVAGEVLNLPISFISKGYASTIEISSNEDISATNFIITGTFNNKTLTEVITGPIGGGSPTTGSVNLYHKISSIRATSSINEAYTIGSNGNVAVILPNYNLAKDNNTKYKILINSLTTLHDWSSPNVLIYGVAGIMPPYLNTSLLTYATRNNNFYAINDPGVDITIDELKRGIIISTDYPFAAIIVCFLDAVNDTPSFVEITQS